MTADPQFWNNLAEDYSRQPVENPEAFDRKIEITKSRMQANHTVLDIGCGTGSLALRLAPFAARVHGLDISSEMVRIGRAKAAADQVENVTFHVGPFDGAVPFEPESLDGICAYSILHLMEDPRASMEQIFALLKPGGFFISSTVCLGDSWMPYRPLIAAMRWAGKAPMVQILPRDSVVEDARAAGFVDIDLPDVGAKNTIAFMVATKPQG